MTDPSHTTPEPTNGRDHHGLTWEDVEGLRSLAESLSQNFGDRAAVAPLLSLADRIAALLPPR